MNPALALLLVTVLSCLASCGATALKPDDIERTELAAIQRSFTDVVYEARRDPDVQWQSGWLGNLAVHMAEGEKSGLCWQWQELVYAGVRPAVLDVGWEVGGIGINVGTYYEHQAVLVWDPEVVGRDRVLEGKQPAWVLDAWDRAEADIIRLDDWLAQFWIIFEPLQFVDLSHLEAEGRTDVAMP